MRGPPSTTSTVHEKRRVEGGIGILLLIPSFLFSLDLIIIQRSCWKQLLVFGYVCPYTWTALLSAAPCRTELQQMSRLRKRQERAKRAKKDSVSILNTVYLILMSHMLLWLCKTRNHHIKMFKLIDKFKMCRSNRTIFSNKVLQNGLLFRCSTPFCRQSFFF